MKRKKILVAATLVVTAVAGSFAFAAQTSAASDWLSILTTTQPQQTKNALISAAPPRESATTPLTNLLTTTQASPTPTSTPEVKPQISYHFFFRRIQLLEKKALEMDAHGENGGAIRRLYQSSIGLTDEQNAFLLKTATDCMTDVKVVDDTATLIVEQLIANNKSQSASPNAPPIVPVANEQLTALQTEREQTVLNYRDSLRNNLGEETFARLENFVKENISSNIQTGVNLQNAKVPAERRSGSANPDTTGNSTDLNNAPAKENK